MSSSSTTSAPASTSSGANASTSSNDPRSAVVGGVLGTLGLILLVGIVLITLRIRRRQKGDVEKATGPFQGTAVVDKSHPAARIVPFGTPGTEAHKFAHTPGRDMRIAVRRPDGAWDFADPSEPFTPGGVSDVCPSPMSSTTHLVSSKRKKSSNSLGGQRSAIMEYKEQESRASQLIRLGYDARDNDLEMSDMPLPHPPPAYGSEPTVGPYVTYRPPGSRVSS